MTVMTTFILHALADTGRTLVPDSDHLLAQTTASQLLLINTVPGNYPYEVHQATEYLLCITGLLQLEADNGSQAQAAAGQMIEIPPGLRHRFGCHTDAVIMTIAQTTAS